MKAPRIRFKSFDDERKIYKLNNMCSLVTKQTGFDYSATIKPALVTQSRNDTYSFIQNKDFDGENINLNTDFYIPKKIAVKFPKITLDTPSLLITISGKIGNVGYYNLKNKAFIGGAVGICKLLKDNGRLLVYALQSSTGQKYFHTLIKASSHSNITVEDIRNIKLILPPSEIEYKKLEDYFHIIDNNIRYHQIKLNKLKNIKQSFLQKMFPKEGKVIPEIRFKGFEGNWENTKLEKIFTERHEVSTITPEYPQLSFTIAEGVINPEDRKTNKRDFLIIDKANKKYLKTEVDDIIYNPSNIVFGAIHRNGLSKGVVSPIYKIFYTDQDAKFLDSLVTRKEFINETKKYLEGTVTKLRSLKPDAFLNIEVLIPPTIEEQIKIGKFFENIDKEIKLYEPKIEKLKNLKKSLLEKMFI